MEALKNIKMVEAARKEAQELVAHDPELTQFPKLAALTKERGEAMHAE